MIFGHADRDWHQELNKLMKFVFVGCSTFAIQSIFYFIFTRWLFINFPHTVAYVLVLFYSLIFNYSINRIWTFGDQIAAKGSVQRYAAVALSASLICAVLFWIGHDRLHFYDFYVIIAVNLIIPFYTFVAHRFYTFHNKPGDALKKFVRSSTR